MPIFGCTLTHSTLADGDHDNRFWIEADNLDDAITKGGQIVTVIEPVFGDNCVFKNIHVWLPRANPKQFKNQAITVIGDFEATNPTSAVPVVRVYMTPSGVSYPNYKDFRICVNAAEQSGRLWGTAVLAAASDVALAMKTLTFLVDDNGSSIEAITVEVEVKYRQLTKKWYNRTAPTP